MIVDIHTHIAGVETENNRNYCGGRMSSGFLFRLFMRELGVPWNGMAKPGTDELIKNRVLRLINESCIDRAVILSLDGVYREDGSFDKGKTSLTVDNDYVADIADIGGKALFGASIHPYRRDAIAELDRLAARGACLVKWLPSSQHIQPDNPRCFPFYDRLAHHQIPLLCHTGNEHTVTGGDNRLNDPQRLVPALERGVTVIAAHCGARMYLHERCYFSSWRKMALEYPNCFGDVGAFIIPTRIRYLRILRNDPRLLSKIVYASDFPAQAVTMSCLFSLGLRKTLFLRKIRNPFDAPYRILKEMGFPDEVFDRGRSLLKIPAGHSRIATGITR